MSKASQARVRDELLQQLYASVLRCTLALVHAGLREAQQTSLALAAGVAANLRAGDLLLLPRRGNAGFRVLSGLPVLPLPSAGRSGGAAAQRIAARGHGSALEGRQGSARPDQPAAQMPAVLPLPELQPAAVAYALGAAGALSHTAGPSGSERFSSVVCVLVPAPALVGGLPEAPGRRSSKHQPASWVEAGEYAARRGLPLLLLSDQQRLTRSALAGSPGEPAPLYPRIAVDREDALAVYRVAFECIARARAGLGPSALAALPFRLVGTPSEPPALARLEEALRARRAYPAAWRRALEQRLLKELDR